MRQIEAKTYVSEEILKNEYDYTTPTERRKTRRWTSHSSTPEQEKRTPSRQFLTTSTLWILPEQDATTEDTRITNTQSDKEGNGWANHPATTKQEYEQEKKNGIKRAPHQARRDKEPGRGAHG